MEQQSPKFTIHPKDNKSHIQRLCSIFQQPGVGITTPIFSTINSFSQLLTARAAFQANSGRDPSEAAIQKQKGSKVAAYSAPSAKSM
ncbi:hypothetical protein Nepgr_032625 [Nepenthes gracilis]|uniref:Uncharacterized protein n=1 Tax=Nepenthes gracilis TaxID=150966 RepID=A0AAD3TL71_NEPGR|nr:hypothetical protein Nepgr_032625 [Nepenthes gracilis]